MLIFQVIAVTWIAITAPEPCPKKYLDMGGDVMKIPIRKIMKLIHMMITLVL